MDPELKSDLLELLEVIEQSAKISHQHADAFHDPNSRFAREERLRARSHRNDAARLTVLLKRHGIITDKEADHAANR